MGLALRKPKRLLERFAAGHQNFSVLSITDEPKAFDNFIARVRFRGFEGDVIMDRHQLFVNVLDGSGDSVDFAFLLEFAKETTSAQDYNSNLFGQPWPRQIEAILDDAVAKAERVSEILNEPSFKERFNAFLRSRARSF